MRISHFSFIYVILLPVSSWAGTVPGEITAFYYSKEQWAPSNQSASLVREHLLELEHIIDLSRKAKIISVSKGQMLIGEIQSIEQELVQDFKRNRSKTLTASQEKYLYELLRQTRLSLDRAISGADDD